MARRKKSDEDESKNENLGNESNSDDTFGLPEIEYKPLDRTEESVTQAQESQPVEQETPSYQYGDKPTEEKSTYTYVPPEEPAPVWPKVLGILLVIVIALGAAWYFLVYQPNQAEKERVLAKQRSEQEAAQRKEAERLAEEQRIRDEAERMRADSIANASKVGVIETLSERTGRYYVVAASAVDDDLLMDHAKKLSASGISTKIIPPFAKYKFYRLTIADGDTFAAAQEVADSKKSEYGDALWVLKY